MELRLPPARPDLFDVPLGWLHLVGRRRARGQEARPRTRRDCADVPRPCPFVGCRYHLWLDEAGEDGELRHHNCDPFDLEESCALDVAAEVAHEDRVVNQHDLAVLISRRKEVVVETLREGKKRLRDALEGNAGTALDAIGDV